MSTTVTFRLVGMSPESVVYLQAAQLESLEEYDETERPLSCYENGNLTERENPKTLRRDDSPDVVDPRGLGISANFKFENKSSSNRRPQLIFFDVYKKTSTENNGFLIVSNIFDRFTEFGTYVVSGATFNSKSGRTVFSNSPVLEISPPPVTLSLLLSRPSIQLGDSVSVVGYVKNNLATPFEGHVTLQLRDGGSTGVNEEFVKVNPHAFKFLKMEVTPKMIGEFFVTLSSNVSNQLKVTKKVRVNPAVSKTQIQNGVWEN